MEKKECRKIPEQGCAANLERGISLFNEERFFDAHEAWEKEWRALQESPEKHFLQGMIIIAGALHHFARKEHTGAERLLERGIELLCASRRSRIDIDREGFVASVTLFYKGVKSLQECQPDIKFPKIRGLSMLSLEEHIHDC